MAASWTRLAPAGTHPPMNNTQPPCSVGERLQDCAIGRTMGNLIHKLNTLPPRSQGTGPMGACAKTVSSISGPGDGALPKRKSFQCDEVMPRRSTRSNAPMNLSSGIPASGGGFHVAKSRRTGIHREEGKNEEGYTTPFTRRELLRACRDAKRQAEDRFSSYQERKVQKSRQAMLDALWEESYGKRSEETLHEQGMHFMFFKECVITRTRCMCSLFF